MKRLALLLVAAVSAAAGCALQGDEEESANESEIRELERRAVGPAQPYPADTFTAEDEERFATSKKARRELGWKVLAKALKPVKIAEKNLPLPEGDSTIPLFRTWLGGDEIDRMFAKAYGDLGPERRKAKDAPTDEEMKALFDWNAASLGPNSETEYLERVKLVTDLQRLNGLAGNARAAYSPGFVKHFIQDYAAVARCEGELEKLTVDTMPISEETNFTNCFSSEFPADAAVVKQSWRRNDEMVSGLPVVDTSAEALGKRVRGEVDEGGWVLRNLPYAEATPEQAYTVRLSEGSGYSLVGLHVMTKELRHWVWVTAWWSDKPDEDFGQDRPEEIKALGAPWSNYKMCVVTDFEEKDPDPRGGFEGSLGDALAAVHGTSTWCSNAFLEKGAHNAQTNCIGCHQHAGDIRSLDSVLKTFPEQGRTKIRKGFPADYSWAFATPASPDQKDRFLDMVLNRIRAYAGE